MDVFIFFIPITVIMICIGIWLLIWCIKNYQYDDLNQKGENILFLDERNSKK